MPPPWALSQTVPSGRPRLPRVRTQNFAINYVRLSSVSREFLSVISRQEFVLDAVRQGLPARFHDVFGDPDRPPFFLVVTRLDQHAHLGGRPMAGCEHRSEEHTSELQSQSNLVCRLLLEKKKRH